MAVSEWVRKFRSLFGRDRATAELEEEMRLHRELRTQSLRTEGAAPSDRPR